MLQVGEEILRWPVEAKIIYAVIAEPKHAMWEITSFSGICKVRQPPPAPHPTQVEWDTLPTSPDMEGSSRPLWGCPRPGPAAAQEPGWDAEAEGR